MNLQEAIMDRFDALEGRLDDLSEQINGKVNPVAMFNREEVARELRMTPFGVGRLVREGKLKKVRNLYPMMILACEVEKFKGIKPMTFF